MEKIFYTKDYAVILSNEKILKDDYFYNFFNKSIFKSRGKSIRGTNRKIISHLPLKDKPFLEGIPVFRDVNQKKVDQDINSLNKQFIPYELALSLKELGFNEPCLASYYHAGRRLDICEYINHGEYTVLASTFSQAFRFFRENYNLKSWIQEHTSDTFIYEIRPHVLTDYKKGEVYVFEKYEDTEMACLKKLIEIIKNKN